MFSSREFTYPTWGKGKSSSQKCRLVWDMLISRRVIIPRLLFFGGVRWCWGGGYPQITMLLLATVGSFTPKFKMLHLTLAPLEWEISGLYQNPSFLASIPETWGKHLGESSFKNLTNHVIQPPWPFHPPRSFGGHDFPTFDFGFAPSPKMAMDVNSSSTPNFTTTLSENSHES